VTTVPLITRLRLGFDVFLLLVFMGAAIMSWGFSPLARYFPLAVTLMGVLFGVGNLAVDLYRYSKGQPLVANSGGTPVMVADEAGKMEAQPDNNAADAKALRGAAYYLAWALGFGLAIWVAGIFVAAAVFLLVFFLFQAKTGWRFAVIATVSAGLVLYGIGDLLRLRWPKSILTDYLQFLQM
jgi:hypothetical protein